MNRNFFKSLHLLFIFKLCILSSITTLAQSDEIKAKLLEKRKKIEGLTATFSGKADMIEALIKEGEEGLALAPETDYESRYTFNIAKGLGHYYQQDFANAAHQFEQAYEAAQKAKLIELSAKPLGHLISVYFYSGQNQKADSAANLLKTIVETVDTLKSKGEIYYNLGIYNQQQKSYYSIALDYYLKALSYQRRIVDTTTIAKRKIDYSVMLSVVADVYLLLGKPQKSIEYLNQALPQQGLSVILDISIYGKMVKAYAMNKNPDSALRYYNLLHKAAVNAPGRASELVSSNIEMVNLAIADKKYDLAFSYLKKAQEKAKDSNNPLMLANINYVAGDYYYAIKDYRQAYNYYKETEKYTGTLNKDQYVDLLSALGNTAIHLNDNATAQEYFAKFTSETDSIIHKKIDLNIAEMEAQYQNKEKAQQIELQKAEIEVASQQQRLYLVGLVALIILAGALFIFYRNKKKNAEQLQKVNAALEEANQTKIKLFSIISHDLRSPINEVYQYLQVQQKYPHLLNESEKEVMSAKVQSSAAALLESMEDLLIWSKTQLNHFTVNKENVAIADIIQESKNLLSLPATAKNIQWEVQVKENATLLTDEKFLATILRNIFSNAIKAAAENTTINVSATEKEIIITNQGKPFSQADYEAALSSSKKATDSSGMGLLLVDEMAKKINATIRFATQENNKTVCSIRF